MKITRKHRRAAKKYLNGIDPWLVCDKKILEETARDIADGIEPAHWIVLGGQDALDHLQARQQRNN